MAGIGCVSGGGASQNQTVMMLKENKRQRPSVLKGLGWVSSGKNLYLEEGSLEMPRIPSFCTSQTNMFRFWSYCTRIELTLADSCPCVDLIKPN